MTEKGSKAQALRALLGLAIRLRVLAEESDDTSDMELFLAAALALENRANCLAFGEPEAPPQRHKVDLFC